MSKLRRMMIVGLVTATALWLLGAEIGKIDRKNLKTGQDAFADASSVKPGTFHHITPNDLPKPFATKSSSNFPRVIARPQDAWPQAPAGFKVEIYASGLDEPRQIQRAPNGDLFVAESRTNEIKIFRGVGQDGKSEQTSVFASGLNRPFGIAFYPPGSNPQFVYVGNTNSVVRYPYHSGDLKTTGEAETVIPRLPSGGFHWTRDLAFSKDGKQLFVAVGTGSNIDDPDTHSTEFHRADILEFTPDGKFVDVYASGIRNPVGIGVNPTTGELWCSVNERDELGDNLVPDYVTHVQKGGFYGWPWYYMGSNPDPRLNGKHPELQGKVLVPDVLLQPHNASLGLTFYDGSQFPKEYHGDLFAAEHGSWNRASRSGYEVIRVPLENGHASGVYEDFLTGFVNSEGQAWGRPVGVAVGKDGSLFITDDASRVIWRVSYTGK